MSKEITNEELLQAISGGFTNVEKQIAEVRDELKQTEKRLSKKIEGMSNRLDNEIIRSTDKHADHEKRITALEVETGLAESVSS